MAKRKIPTVDELREYLSKEDAYLIDGIVNNKPFVITGPRFPGESIWRSETTLPLMEAAECVGAQREEIWKLCSKIASVTHAPIRMPDYERMKPFAENCNVVDVVLKYFETNEPMYDEERKTLELDIIGYSYCIALISWSDYRRDDCEKQLLNIADLFVKQDKSMCQVLLRNMRVMESCRPNLKPIKELLQKALE